MSDPEPRLLRAFLALSEAGSVTQAAARLGISQPTMSGHLRRLREHFADPLFLSDGRKLTPSPRALALRPTIQAVVAGLDALRSGPELWRAAMSDRRFRLAASGYVMDLIGPDLDARLAAGGASLGLEVVSPASAAAADADLAIGPREAVAPGRKLRALFEDRLVCLLDPAHRPDDGRLRLETFCAMEHLLLAPASSPPHDAVDVALRALGLGRRVGRVVAEASALAPLLIGRRRLAMVPGRIANHLGDSLWLAPAPVDLPAISFVMSWPIRLHHDVAARWFREQTRAAIATTCA